MQPKRQQDSKTARQQDSKTAEKSKALIANSLVSHDIWRKRFNEINTTIKDVHIPENVDDETDQDEEWCEVVTQNKSRRIRFHDYDEVFEIPGLYEKLFYDTLKCCSPSYVVNLLQDVAQEWGVDLNEFSVLDVGAGNGMVGDELRHRGVRKVVGSPLPFLVAVVRQRLTLLCRLFVACNAAERLLYARDGLTAEPRVEILSW